MTTEPAPIDVVGPGLGLRHEAIDETVTIWLVGDVDHATAGDLMSYCQQVVSPSCRRLILDCTEMEFMDSGGLRVLVALHTDIVGSAGEVVLRHCTRSVRRVLQVTGLDSVLVVEP